MKRFVQFTVCCAWVLFAAAIWQSPRAINNRVIGRSLPSVGLLSISRKITEPTPAVRIVLPESQTLGLLFPALRFPAPPGGL